MSTDTSEGERLLQLLDGLPLAIAQAGAYLQESGVGLETYLRFYEQQWDELMQADSVADAPLQDYPDRSVWTTWAISYQAIRNKHEHTANLLLLWSFLDNKDLWHGLFAAACEASAGAKSMLSGWVGEIASSELAFSSAMQLLRNYSLVEKAEAKESYATHAVVHRWAYHYQGKHFECGLGRLALAVVAWAVPNRSARHYWIMQRRLLPPAQASFLWATNSKTCWNVGDDKQRRCAFEDSDSEQVLLDAFDLLGGLWASQGKLTEAEQMYERALRWKEKAFGPEHLSTLKTVGNMGSLCKEQGKLAEAERMLERALKGYKILEPGNVLQLKTIGNLGLLYKEQGRLADAERMYMQALQGFERLLGFKDPSTLLALNNLGVLYKIQGRLTDAERIYKRALEGKGEALGSAHPSTLQTLDNLGVVYVNQGRLAEAERMYEQALYGKKEALGSMHPSTLQTIGNIGNLYHRQSKLADAERMLQQALQGYKDVLGHEHPSTLNTINNLGVLFKDQGRLVEAEQLLKEALRGRTGALGPKHTSTLETVNNLGNLYKNQSKLAEAQRMYERALQGYKDALGDTHVRQHVPALNTSENLGDLYVEQQKPVEAHEMYSWALPGLQTVFGQSSERCKQLEARMHASPTLQASNTKRTQVQGVADSLRTRLQQDKKVSKSRFRTYVKGMFQ